MMNIVKLVQPEEIRATLWPAFKLDNEVKHGQNGLNGGLGEQAAIKLIKEHYPNKFKSVIDHANDCIGQLQGVDLTFIGRSDMRTVDVKTGRTGLYWNKERKYWFITIREEFFNNPLKVNSHFMHVGPKKDIFAWYPKAAMEEYFLDCPDFFHKAEHGYVLKKQDWPDFIEHSLG
jgi:hypothetical protein